MKIRLLLLRSLCNIAIMSPRKWTVTDTALPITEKQQNCVLKIQTRMFTETINYFTAYCPTFS